MMEGGGDSVDSNPEDRVVKIPVTIIIATV